MQYFYSKDFILTSGREVLFYDSAKYNPSDNLRPSSALAVLRHARSVLGFDGMLNPIAGISAKSRYLTSLKWGTYQDSFDLIDLCTRDRSSDPVSPTTSNKGKSYIQYSAEGINTISLMSVSAPVTSGADYNFTNPTFSGDLTVTFRYDAQLVNSTKQPNKTNTTVYTVVPLGINGRYSGLSSFTFTGDTCAFSFGRRVPTFNRTDSVFSPFGGSTTKVVQSTSASDEFVNIDCFLMYDPESGVFKRYGSDKIAQIDPSLIPGSRPLIALNSRTDHVSINM